MNSSALDQQPENPLRPEDTRELLSQLSHRYRGYLWTLAYAGRGAGFRNQVDPADIVQTALARAVESLHQLAARDERSMLAWLRQILSTVLVDEYRRLHRARRDIAREQQEIAASINSTAAGLEAWLVADQTSPSRAAARNEQLLRLADALLELPEEQREAVVMKYLQGHDLPQIATTMGKTVPSVAGLLRRGLGRLRELLPPD
ncbi:MAG: polymerase sigma factor SigH [Planctomycetota bacterium]|jgi:RNA polymerase sigma-70 factor (ECF subfamily)